LWANIPILKNGMAAAINNVVTQPSHQANVLHPTGVIAQVFQLHSFLEFMKTLPQFALFVVGMILGVPVGAALGFYSVRWGGSLVYGRDFNRLSWFFLSITVPGGAIFGAALGGLTIVKRPRLFAWTILPLSIFFIGQLVFFSTLRGMDRPRAFELEVVGTRGAQYVGVVSVDGNTHKLKGELPGKHSFTGFRIELAFALVNSKGQGKIAVEASADGNLLNTGGDSQTGVYLDLKSYGYSEKFGGTETHWLRMSPEDVDALFKEDRIPARYWP
jgi:hypothetical protein